MSVFLLIFSRWAHVVTACVAVGGVFFARVILPAGLSVLDQERRQAVNARTRRAFKMVIHCAIAIFLLSGIYNSTAAWDKYARQPALLHALWGAHLLLALLAMGLALYILAGVTPRRSGPRLMAINLALLLAAVAAASSLKWAREHAAPNATIQLTR